MGVDTKAYYINITRDQLFDFIKLFLDNNAKHELRSIIHEDYSQIHFTYKNEYRDMNVHRTDIDVKRDMKKYNVKDPTEVDSGVYVDQQGLPDKTKGTKASLGKWGNSIEIMKIIAYYFSGYVDEDDCDSKDFYFIKKNLHKLIKSII